MLKRIHETKQGRLYIEQNHTVDNKDWFHVYLSLNCENIGPFECYRKTTNSEKEALKWAVYLYNLLNGYEQDSKSSLRLFV